MKTVCVFTGSNRGNDPVCMAAAEELGEAIAGRGMGLVYGASKVGLMGVVADAVLSCGGEVTGVIPRALLRKELLHSKLTHTHVVASMHERKARFAELSDGFIALPGGLGTLEELFEVWTWAQLGFHAKPVGMLNAGGYFDRLLRFLDDAVNTGFVRQAHRELLIVRQEPDGLLDAMIEFAPVAVEKWLDDSDAL